MLPTAHPSRHLPTLCLVLKDEPDAATLLLRGVRVRQLGAAQVYYQLDQSVHAPPQPGALLAELSPRRLGSAPQISALLQASLLQGDLNALSSRLTAYLLLPAQTYSEGKYSYTPAYCYQRVALFLPSPSRLQLLLLAPCLPGECSDPADPPETFEPL